jgi:hypothetical protein
MNNNEGEVLMITNPVHSSAALSNEAAVKAAPRQNAAPLASLPQDKVTISPQAHAQVQAQVHAQQAASAGKNHDVDRK